MLDRDKRRSVGEAVGTINPGSIGLEAAPVAGKTLSAADPVAVAPAAPECRDE